MTSRSSALVVVVGHENMCGGACGQPRQPSIETYDKKNNAYEMPVKKPRSSTSLNAMLRVALFGTHPRQYNGYSKVVYELAQRLGVDSADDMSLYVFGFQNFYPEDNHRRDVSPNVSVFDAFAEETPRQQGFGINAVKTFVEMCRPHVAVVYNDMAVLSAVINELRESPLRPTFKIIAYIDQVYPFQKRSFIQMINTHVDAAFLFTPGWRKCIQEQGLAVPCHCLPHGINVNTYFPIPTHVARRYFGLDPSDFIVMNLNRNQPRKRWDTCLKALAEIVHRQPESRIKLLVATQMTGAWDLVEMYERELKKRGLTLQQGMRHLIQVDAPQRLSDVETNILYNVADIGINTCDGEGFGLCNFEQAAIGIPQVVAAVGAFVELFDDECARLIQPRVAYYVDSSRDVVGGEAFLCDYADFADAIEEYYADPELKRRHGQNARDRLTRRYRWETIARHFSNVVHNIATKTTSSPETPVQTSVSLDAHENSVADDIRAAIEEAAADDRVVDNTDEPTSIPTNVADDVVTIAALQAQIEDLKSLMLKCMASQENTK